MELGISTWKDILGLIAALALPIIIWFLGKRITIQQFRFNVMISCITRFQSIVPDLGAKKKEVRLSAIAKYIDLCNEELFYFKQNYVEKEVMNEWLDGMIDYMPWFSFDGENINTSSIIDSKSLVKYPRIKNVFRIDKKYDLNLPKERKQLVEITKSNIKKFNY